MQISNLVSQYNNSVANGEPMTGAKGVEKLVSSLNEMSKGMIFAQTLVSTWIVMALLSGLAFWLGRDLKLENVSKRQAAAEFIVERLDQFVHDNMGHHFDQYIPLVGAIFAFAGARLCKRRTALWQSRVAQYVLGYYDSGR